MASTHKAMAPQDALGNEKPAHADPARDVASGETFGEQQHQPASERDPLLGRWRADPVFECGEVSRGIHY